MNNYASTDENATINLPELVADLAALGVRKPDHIENHGHGDGFSMDWALDGQPEPSLSWHGNNKFVIDFHNDTGAEGVDHIGLESAAAHLRSLGCGLEGGK